MNNLKVWPHLTIIAVLVAVAAGVGVALWMRNDQTVSAETLPNAARIQRVEGDVAALDAVVLLALHVEVVVEALVRLVVVA